MRHADAGYERALEVAAERGVRIPMREQRVTRAARSSTIGDPVLRERAREVTPRGAWLAARSRRLIDDLIETKRAADGAGLAANQVGEPLRIAVAEVDRTTRAIRTSRRSR